MRDATSGDELPAATVTHDGAAVRTLSAENCDGVPCTHAVSPPLSGTLVVSLAGYRDAGLDFAAKQDECGNLIRQRVVVDMMADTSTGLSTTSAPLLAGAGCNQ